MSHELELIRNLTIAIATALAGGLVAHTLRQSPIVGYIVAGMLIGPHTPGYVGNRPQIEVLSHVGVILLMFALGIEFSLKDLGRIKAAAIGGTILQLLLTIAAGWGLGCILGWKMAESVFFGGIIAVSSTMVILKNLMNRGEMTSNHGRLLLAMLIVQDLAVVVLMLLLPQVVGKGGNAIELLLVLFKALAFIGATLFLGDRVIPRLMMQVERLRSPELFLLTAVVLALGMAALSAWLGLSAPLGAFLAGLMLTETEFDHRVIAEMVPMRDLFATLFFVSIGMLIDVRFIIAHPLAIIGLALFIVIVKAVVTTVALLPFRMGGKTTLFAGLGMIPIGEFNYVMAQKGLEVNAITVDQLNLILTSSLLTIALAPAALWIAPRADLLLGRLPWLGRLFAPASDELPEIASLQDHAVVVGYGRVGRRMARGLRQAGLRVVIIEQDLAMVRELTAQGTPAVLGDASYTAVLKAAHAHLARVVVVALPDFGATRAVVHRVRHDNPNALIVARAQHSENDVKLRAAGATAVVVPEIAGALMVLQETLILLGLPHDHIFTGIPAINVPPTTETIPSS